MCHQCNFYPRSPYGERLPQFLSMSLISLISIHALLTESDRNCKAERTDGRISIHALLTESDCQPCPWLSHPRLFLSTLSLRRATLFFGRDAPKPRYFYPRSPYGERPSVVSSTGTMGISIHALLTESDLICPPPGIDLHISIHALLTESDRRPGLFFQYFRNFYPRSPYGERPPITFRHCTTYLFLSTLSLRRATTEMAKTSNADTKFLSTLSLRRATTPSENVKSSP